MRETSTIVKEERLVYTVKIKEIGDGNTWRETTYTYIFKEVPEDLPRVLRDFPSNPPSAISVDDAKTAEKIHADVRKSWLWATGGKVVRWLKKVNWNAAVMIISLLLDGISAWAALTPNPQLEEISEKLDNLSEEVAVIAEVEARNSATFEVQGCLFEELVELQRESNEQQERENELLQQQNELLEDIRDGIYDEQQPSELQLMGED